MSVFYTFQKHRVGFNKNDINSSNISRRILYFIDINGNDGKKWYEFSFEMANVF